MERAQSPSRLERPAKRARTEEPTDAPAPVANSENGSTPQVEIEEEYEGEGVEDDALNDVTKGSDLYLDTVRYSIAL